MSAGSRMSHDREAEVLDIHDPSEVRKWATGLMAAMVFSQVPEALRRAVVVVAGYQASGSRDLVERLADCDPYVGEDDPRCFFCEAAAGGHDGDCLWVVACERAQAWRSRQ